MLDGLCAFPFLMARRSQNRSALSNAHTVWIAKTGTVVEEANRNTIHLEASWSVACPGRAAGRVFVEPGVEL
jgi:hypothetical protein